MGKKVLMQITSNNTKGEVPPNASYINLSSMPQNFLGQHLVSRDNTDMVIRMIPIQSIIRYNNYTHTINKVGRRKKNIVVVVDEDDKNQNTKIRNLIRRGRFNYMVKL